jgi:hypothetical protein
MPKYNVMTYETVQHFYTVEASSLDEAEEIYNQYEPDNTYPQSEDVEHIKEISP